MATYTYEDLHPRNNYFVAEVYGHVRVEDIDRWMRTGVWAEMDEILHEFEVYKEAEDFVRRTNAEAKSIIEDVERKGEESKHVEEEEDDEGYPTFYIEYVFDRIDEREVSGLDGHFFSGDTFKIGKTKGYEKNNLRGKEFNNCKFIGGGLEFDECKFFNCTFSDVNSITFYYSRFEDCDFTQSSNILLDPRGGEEIIRCKFDGARLKEHIKYYLLNLSGTSGFSVEDTDPKGDRRRNLSEEMLTVEEIASIREEEEREEEARRVAIQDITRRVSRAKKDKELEALAQEVGALQAQPDYVKEYKKVLNDLQGEIEKKYSVLGKGLKYLKRLFGRGKRASQVRIASQMNREIQREIKALKRDLRK